MDNKQLIDFLIQDYNQDVQTYKLMKEYYDGIMAISYHYPIEENRSNTKTVINMVSKFIEEEVIYVCGFPFSYISKSGNKQIINDVDYQLYHWQDTHNQELTRQLEIYGKVYELYYINARGEFCGRILNPTNAIVYTDSDNIPQLFIHFYQKKYDTAKYYDVYFPDHIEIYKDNTLIDAKTHIFKGVPVSICSIGFEQTIFNKIKDLNDSLNLIVSDQINIINDYRAAYLVITGAEVDESTSTTMKTKGILNLPDKDGSVSWLMKDVPDTYIQNMINLIKDSAYSVCNHLDGNQELPSNTSGVAIRQRLIFLEQRCKSIFDTVADTISDRIGFLFQYLNLKNLEYDWKDISVTFNPCVPQDLAYISQVLTQLGDKISHSTFLSQLPFIENVEEELNKIKKERAELEEIDLDKIEAVN